MEISKKLELNADDYKSLFDKLYLPLCVFANRYLNNLDMSKDIVQDVFVKVWEDKVSYPHDNAIRSYFYTSVRNRSLDYLKSKHHKITNTYSDADIEKMETEAFFLNEVFFVETSTVIENAIETLPDKCAEIMRLSIKEYTNIEIAKELSISINTVKTQKKIAYQKLRKCLYFLNGSLTIS